MTSSFIDRRQTTARNFVLAFAVIAACALALLVAVAIRVLLHRWIRLLVGDISSKRFLDDAKSSGSSLPVLMQVRQALRDLEASQRLEIEFQENWTPQALQQVVRDQLKSCPMIVVSNREPYIHNLDATGRPRRAGAGERHGHRDRADHARMLRHLDCARQRDCGSARRGPAMTTCACRRTSPSYDLRRVWLSPEEEEGYYYGFSNEGLWPLCHLAYVRPAFRERDWQQYVAVNATFRRRGRAAKPAGSEPVMLIQDFHFALLPQLIRERGVNATIALFWHIPWPNAETFGVCPWKREILLHMLQRRHPGLPHPLPLPELPGDRRPVRRMPDRPGAHDRDPPGARLPGQGVPDLDRVAAALAGEYAAPGRSAARAVRQRWGIGPDVRIGVGVERWDFTKGIVERFLALEALFEKHPRVAWPPDVPAGRRAVAQQAARLPGDTAADAATSWSASTRASATGTGSPIVLIGEHQEPAQVFELYRAADFCLVNSLHDGMNLVAKEFVAARDDEDGVLVLSTFTGASRELVEALLVNPFDVSETAAAIVTALEMPREERRKRMQLMRRTISEANVYRWAGRMLMDVARIRQRQSLTSTGRLRPETATSITSSRSGRESRRGGSRRDPNSADPPRRSCGC